MFLSVGCKDKKPQKNKSISQKVKINNYQLVFDFQNMEAHNEMMEHSDIKMTHKPETTHMLLLTPINEQNMGVLKDAQVSCQVGQHGPKRSTINKEEMKVMEGGGMYHYYVEIELNDAQQITAQCEIIHEEKNVNIAGGVSFSLN